MSMLKNAHALLAVLQLMEQVTDAVAEKHAKGEDFTIGDLAAVIAEEAPFAVAGVGIADHPWKPAPPKRGGPRKVTGTPAGKGEGSQ